MSTILCLMAECLFAQSTANQPQNMAAAQKGLASEICAKLGRQWSA
ncbi:MAG: hypothetical protein PWQ97_932 [Tepidanaerobacteraceae bacterium]|nr:hypothetical protein [Tepidanaerobacteraceae bacterium]